MPKNLFILLTLLLALPISYLIAEDRPNERVARIILFVPDGSDLPKNYQKRFEELALKTEAFFNSELARNGWKRPSPGNIRP